MKAIVCQGQGGPEVLSWREVSDPVAGPDDVVIKVRASAVNRADILQRRGSYPPPPGASPLLGLEVAGEVESGPLPPGARVMALLPGGGYAEKAVVPRALAMPIPDGWSFTQAAAFPEVWLTAFDNLLGWGRLAAGETVLIHGGGSGVGTAAIQLARWKGARALVTCGSARKGEACLALGAGAWFDHQGDWPQAVTAATDGRGVDVILDVMGGSNLGKNVASLATLGRLVVIGLQGGTRGELDLGRLLSRRLTVMGTTLRARPVAEKAALTERIVREVLPAFAQGQLRVVVDRVLPLERAADAHRVMEAGDHIGKIVLEVS